MARLRVYVDTSVFGGCFDREFETGSRAFFEAISAGKVLPLVSEIVARELANAPEQVQQTFAQIIEGECERLAMREATASLASAYVQAGVVTPRCLDDALHVAMATQARADVIASWNFRHLVNPTRIRGFNSVNVAQGHGQVVILTPEDVAHSLEEGDEGRDEDV